MVLSRKIGAWMWVMSGLVIAASLQLMAAPLETSPLRATIVAASAAADAKDPAVGNYVASLSNGYDALLLRVHLIRQARTSVAIQTFIWTNDECGRLLIYELIEAAKRGVKVRILADHLISEQDPATVAFLATAHPNLEVKHYRPSLARMKPSLWRKLLAGALS